MAGSKVTVGNVEIVSLLDTPMEFPWAAFFPSVPQAEFEAYRDLYPGSFGADKFRTYAQCSALRSAGKTVLVDTGVGTGMGGRLLDDMADKGVSSRDEVDVVVFTHLHMDHVAWNLGADGKPNFPNARYMVPQGDWDAFTKPDVAAQNPHIGTMVAPLKDLGVMDLFSGETAITEELTTYPTPGHTPGHTSILVSSGGEKAFIAGDLAHHPAQVDRTEWCGAFDGDPAQAIESRNKVFDQLEADGLIAMICHFPEPGFGKLVRLEGKRVFQAL